MLKISKLYLGIWLVTFLSLTIEILAKPITIQSKIEEGSFVELPENLLRQTLHLKDSLEQYYETDLAGTLMLEDYGYYLHFQGLNSVYK